ncbi:MAG: phenylalanine--tRNA ligase subunit beta [Candidatus Campbellbacteria bacterium]|nr:phenylalanine--tRNA ligase subunit beta [Candidatus Campbellbacteria bacterium]
MRVLRSILEDYTEAPLPPTEDVAHALTMKSYEVEEIGAHEGLDFLEVDVLPNRASDSLSHFGIARETANALRIKHIVPSEIPTVEESSPGSLDIEIEEGTARRFVAVTISGLNKATTPKWLKSRLEALGERSINPIVDVTNYVMLLTGQPLHAYDACKLEEITGGKLKLTSRIAKEGETLISLEGEEINFSGGELIIAADDKVLGVAGIKGGKESGVNENTDKIVLEAACFNPVMIRKTSQAIKLKTNASKRFENEVPPELSLVGISEALRIFKELAPDIEVVALKDEYPDKPKERKIELDTSHAASLIGVEIPKETQIDILKMIGCEVSEEGNLIVTPPWYRLDLEQSVDLVEEIGRLYGYENVPEKELGQISQNIPSTPPAKEIIRDQLMDLGYSEIITRSFRKKGDVAVANPLDKEQPFLRKNLKSGIENALELNARNAELLELEIVRVFEIGTIFKKDKEIESLSLGASKTKNCRHKFKPDQELDRVISDLDTALGIKMSAHELTREVNQDSFVIEFDLDAILQKISDNLEWSYSEPPFKAYNEFSPYPYVLRDVAVWTPEGTTANEVREIIKSNASGLLGVITLFDTFEKDFESEKFTSYAFRLVFQSFQKTLSDEEVNEEMQQIYGALSSRNGFEIR